MIQIMSFLYRAASLGSTNNYQISFAERTIKLFKNQISTQFLWTFSKKLAFSFIIIPPQAIYFPSKFC